MLGAFFFFSAGLAMGVTAIYALVTGEDIRTEQTIFFLVFGFEGIVLSIAAFVSIQKFINKSSADEETSLSLPGWQIVAFIVIAGIAILTGNLIKEAEPINWIFLPLLTLPAVALPLWIILGLGIQKIPLGARWRTWNILGLGMTLGPFILILLEVFAAIVVLVGVVAYIVLQPELVAEIQSLARQMELIDPNSEAAVRLFLPYLTRPLTIVVALTYFSVIVPAIEEVFKPIGVWLFAARLESSAQGFALGALSGAGYALVETFGVSGQSGEWGSLLFSRIGTGLLHIATSAMMGAAIFMAWRERRYLRLFGTYLLTTALHGIWNASALAYSFSTLMNSFEGTNRFDMIILISMVSMTLLTAAFFAILIVSNRRLQVAKTMDIKDGMITTNVEDDHDKHNTN